MAKSGTRSSACVSTYSGDDPRDGLLTQLREILPLPIDKDILGYYTKGVQFFLPVRHSCGAFTRTGLGDSKALRVIEAVRCPKNWTQTRPEWAVASNTVVVRW